MFINKGSDAATYALAEEHKNNEVAKFQLERYECSDEAVWKILSFSIQEKYPTIAR